MWFRGAEWSLLALASWMLVPCCTPKEGEEQRTAPAAPASTGEAKPSEAKPRQIQIPLGELEAGTLPGRFERDPAIAPAPFSVKLGEFTIDRGLYPNLADKPPLLGSSREEASRLCGESGGRLCTELEWERACRGPEQHPFATGKSWNDHCAGHCESGFGVQGMGSIPEWTASSFGPDSVAAGAAVVRGPISDTPTSSDRRCAHRTKAPAKPPQNIGFRCCHGAPNAARVPEPVDGPIYRKRPMEKEELMKLLESHPKTSDLTRDLVVFGEPEAINTVIGRGPGDRMGFDFTTTPLLWRPTLGAQFLVLTAKSGQRDSFVLVYHAIGDDRFELASSFLMHGEEGPVILAYSDSIRPRLHFSSCWGCPGETGKVLFREPDRAVVLQP